MITSPVRKSRRLVHDFGFKMTIVVCWIAVAKEKRWTTTTLCSL